MSYVIKHQLTKKCLVAELWHAIQQCTQSDMIYMSERNVLTFVRNIASKEFAVDPKPGFEYVYK